MQEERITELSTIVKGTEIEHLLILLQNLPLIWMASQKFRQSCTKDRQGCYGEIAG